MSIARSLLLPLLAALNGAMGWSVATYQAIGQLTSAKWRSRT
jgi:hypothetical protein